MNLRLSKKAELFLILITFLSAFVLRLYRFDNPIADWFSWRQADTSAVSRNFVTSGFDLLHPRFDDLSNVPSGIDNPNGYRFVEFPIYNLFQAGAYKIFGVFNLEEWGRLVTIFGSLFSAGFLYLLIKKRFGLLVGFLSTFFFLFLPYSIYYSRVILPDPLMVTAILGATYFFDKWLDKNLKLKIYDSTFLASIILTSASFLLKPYALFFTLPMIYLAFEKFGLSFFKKWKLWIFAIITLIPLIAWRIWMTHFPEGIPASNWLFNGNHIRFRPSFFYWIFYQRLTKLILGYFGVLILIFAFFRKYKSKDLFFILSFILSSVIYVFVLATGNVQHDYYQILIIPTISIVLALASQNILNRFEKIQKFLGIGILSILIIISFYFSWSFVKDYFNINNWSIISAGKAVDRLTPKNSKIIANYTGDTSFLYQTKRKGWASFEKPLPEMVSMGANYLVLVNPTRADLNLGKTYKIVEKTNMYVIFNLTKKP